MDTLIEDAVSHMIAVSHLANIPCLAEESAFEGCTSLSELTLPDAPKVSESLRKALPQLYRALKKSGAKPVPKLTWSAPATLATIGDRASSGCPRLAKLPNQRRCPHYRYRRVRLLLQQLWKSEFEVWIAELEIRAGTAPGSLYSAESAGQRSTSSTASRPYHYELRPWLKHSHGPSPGASECLGLVGWRFVALADRARATQGEN